ncbi:MAG: YybS family protein [Candidatus Hydrogenedentes bacterium]|nr:YybS family protein [Candidatus Hydrogenedentota bacterium]
MAVFGACGALLLGLSPIVIAVALIRGRGWVALLVLLLLAAFFGVGLYAASQDDNPTADLQRRALLLYSVLTYALLSAPGLAAATAHARKWSYSKTAYAVAGLLFVILTLSVVLEWELWKTQVDGTIEEFRLMIHARSAEGDESVANQQLEGLAWLSQNKAAFGLGLNSLFALAVSCIYITITNYVLRLWRGEAGFAGSFKDMRPTEWLVWGAIVTALLCFADHRWPELGIRFVAWNAAVVLTAVYWFNGLSIAMYGIRTLQPTVTTLLLVFVFVVVLVNMGVLPVLALAGLFDTWGDYRGKFDAMLAARNAREDGQQGPPGTGI